MGPVEARWIVSALVALLLGQAACFPWLADTVGRQLLGETGGLESSIVAFQFLRVLPAVLVFTGVASWGMLAAGQRSRTLFWLAVMIVVIVDLVLLVISVMLYFQGSAVGQMRRRRGNGRGAPYQLAMLRVAH